MAELSKETFQALKFFGLVGRMRKHQNAYFRSRMQYDKSQAMKYEKLVDDYIKLLIREGWQPIFEDNKQSKMF